MGTVSSEPSPEPQGAPGAAEGRRGSSWVRSWAADSAVLLSSQVLTVVASSATAILVARSLSPRDWGIFAAFLGLSLALSIVTVFGLGTWLLRELSDLVATEDDTGADVAALRGKASRLVSSGLVLNAIIGLPLVLAGAVYAVAAGVAVSVGVALVALLLYAPLTAAATSTETYLRARRRVGLVAAAQLVEKGLLVALVAGALVAGRGIATIGLVYVVAAVARLSFDTVLVAARFGLAFVWPSSSTLRRFARAAAPFAVSTSAFNLLPRLDTALVATMSATSAGWFAIGERSLGPALLVSATLASTLFPFMVRRSERSTAHWKLSLALGAGGAALATLGALVAPTIVPLVFGEEYTEAVRPTQIMLFMLPFTYAASPLLVFAYARGRERSIVVVAIGLSLVGTLAIVGGQALGGATLAAAAAVLRSALFLTGIAAVDLDIRRRSASSATSVIDVTSISGQET